MNNKLLLTITTCALLALVTNVHAAPMTSKRRSAHICAMCKDKSTRMMMIHELTSTRERKQEMARELEHDDEFRSYYETQALNPG